MSKVDDWINAHPKGINFKCNCGSTVHMDAWVDGSLFCMSAVCWKCDKALEQYEHTMLVDMAICDVIDELIDKFQRDFNRNKKQNIIRVVK